MTAEIFVFLLSAACVAFIVVSAAGALFAGLTLGSPHVKWFLPSLAALVGLIAFGSVFAEGGLRWWQPIPGVLLLWWVVRDYRDPLTKKGKPYVDLWIAAVMKASVVLLGFIVMAVFSIDHHHHG
jgi:hypothetical protein